MEEEVILTAEIDIQSHFSPFDFPTLPEVIKAIESQLPEDRLKIVKALRGPLLGLYKITSTDYNLYRDKKVSIRNIEIPVTLWKKQHRQTQERSGILVTIYDAFDGAAQKIPGDTFNRHFSQFDGVKFIRQVTP